MECRKLKLVTSWNAAGMFVVAVLTAFTSVSTEARAMLVYSYYSSQIIVTTATRLKINRASVYRALGAGWPSA
jgi:hypothetical protein